MTSNELANELVDGGGEDMIEFKYSENQNKRHTFWVNGTEYEIGFSYDNPKAFNIYYADDSNGGATLVEKNIPYLCVMIEENDSSPRKINYKITDYL